MAQKVQVLLVDDLEGGEADETVAFALDGKTYEIDLTATNADRLRGILEPYAKAGRKVSGRRKTVVVKRTEVASGSAAIRAWAKSNGWPDMGNRGRVPAEVQDAFEKANKGK
ncbi:Lsr2 family protein [Streptomyces noursei]|uniref:histone-like nucleoid-structuring protein Lsr2 n=1 Tax=Streptomyces noursei TaxID=1971 RepID=UPI00344DE6C5